MSEYVSHSEQNEVSQDYLSGRKAMQQEALSIHLPEGYDTPYWMTRGLIEAVNILKQDTKVASTESGPGRDIIAQDFAEMMVFASHLAQEYGIDLDEAVEKLSKDSESGYLIPTGE